VKRAVGGILAILVLAGIGVGWKLYLATEAGGACADSAECRGFDGECLSIGTASYCTKRCVGTADCPTGWTCTTAEQMGGQGGSAAVCVRPQ
jgi:hypothetical protein